MRYTVVDDKKRVVNVVEWDGKTEWQPPEGCSVREYEDGDMQLLVASDALTVPTLDQLLDKLSKVKSVADISTAATQMKGVK